MSALQQSKKPVEWLIGRMSAVIQSQLRIQDVGGLGAEQPTQAGMRSYQCSSYHGYRVPEGPAPSLPVPPLPSLKPSHKFSSLSYIHTHSLFTLRLGVCVWSTVNLMRMVNWSSLEKDSLKEKNRNSHYNTSAYINTCPTDEVISIWQVLGWISAVLLLVSVDKNDVVIVFFPRR